MVVIVKEDGLCIDVGIQADHAFQLVLAGDLTVDDAVTVVSSRIFIQSLFDGVEDLVQAGIADGMNGDMHIMFIGVGDHLIELFIGE